MNPQHPQGGSSGTSPHLSIELLEKLLPAFLLAAENRERSRRELALFPGSSVPHHETLNAALGSNIYLSSSPARTSQNPSSEVDLSLRLGPPRQGAIGSPALSSRNIFAPSQAVGVQGTHRGTSNAVHPQTKRGFPDYASGELHVGRSLSMGQLGGALAKRRATESHISANNVNPSPPLSPMQLLFGNTTPTPAQGGLRDKGKSIVSSSSSQHRQIGLPAQAYIQERPQYLRSGSSPSLDLKLGPPSGAAGISTMQNLRRILFEQILENENMQNAQTDKLDYAEVQADMLLNDTEEEDEEEEEEIPDQDDQKELHRHQEGDVPLAPHGERMEDLLDDEGKYIIEPIGKGWGSAQQAVDDINYVIQSQFRGAFHSNGMIPLADRQEWFRMFKEKCTWEARHEQQIRKDFDSYCSKYLADILTQARNTRKKPQWMKMEHWIELLAYWDTPSFNNISAGNMAFNKGRPVHTGGCKAFTDLAKKFGPDPYPGEFVLPTHKYKSTDHWEYSQAQKTYEEYQRRLLQQQSQVGEASSSATQESRVDLWSEFAKGRSSGHVYGTIDFGANVHPKATSLTLGSGVPPSSSEASEE